MNRRQFLTLGSSTGILLIAGCSGTNPQTATQNAPQTTETPTQTTQITEATSQTTQTPQTTTQITQTTEATTQTPQTTTDPSTSTETPTEQSAQAVKVLSQSFYTNDGKFGVEGEVKNVTNHEIMILGITVKFFSDKGVRIASGNDRLNDIAPGQTVSYHAETSTSDVSPKRVGDWTLTFDPTITSGQASIPAVDVLSKERYMTKTGKIGLRGQVKNISDETVDISLEVEFFTDHGETLATASGRIPGLQPGKVARYDLQTSYSVEKKVQDYKLTVSG